MDSREQELDNEQLHEMSTGELVRHALDEAKLLAKAEILHAKNELKQELQSAKLAAILIGSAAALSLCGLSVLFVALALVLPLSHPLGALVVGLVLVALAAAGAGIGVKNLPKKPLPKTQERLKKDFQIAREQLQ